jgi:glycosyltransferase involved in cell wall biosynthesis
VPRVVLGLPTYCAAAFVSGVLDSLLSQDFADLAIVAIDDCSSDDTVQIANRYAQADSRLTVESNAERLGMIPNWNRVLARACELHGDFEFYAWVSDNDFRERTWVSALVRALEEDPAAALAYSRFGVIEEGTKVAPPGWLFETRGMESPLERLRACQNSLRAGPIMYGLHRRTTLDRAGDVPRVLLSDYLFLSHLSLYGPFLQEPEVLWYRGARKTGSSSRRQRAVLFSGRPPLLTFLPHSLQHTVWLIRWMVFGNRRPEEMSRGRALATSVLYFVNWWSKLFTRALTSMRKRRVKISKARGRKRKVEERKRKAAGRF